MWRAICWGDVQHSAHPVPPTPLQHHQGTGNSPPGGGPLPGPRAAGREGDGPPGQRPLDLWPETQSGASLDGPTGHAAAWGSQRGLGGGQGGEEGLSSFYFHQHFHGGVREIRPYFMCYFRFLDDIWGVWPYSETEFFLNKLNNHNSSISSKASLDPATVHIFRHNNI